MEDHVYKIIEIVGTSTKGVSEAVHNGLRRANESVRNIRWFETQQIRGRVDNGVVQEFQVTLKIGFTLDGASGGLARRLKSYLLLSDPILDRSREWGAT